MFGEFTHKKLDLDGEMEYNLRMKLTKDPCEECLIAHYCQENFGKSGCPRARAALRRVANLERLIVKAGPSIAAIAKSYHLYPDFVQTIRPLIAETARIAKRKAAARLARRGKP